MNKNPIRQKIESQLTHDPRVKFEQCKLDIDVNNGTVSLSGSVPSVAAKRLAFQLAKGTDGVEKVEDRILVNPPMPMGDREILDHIRKAFIQEKNIELENIDIHTDPLGRVTLQGHARSLIQKRLCEVLSWWVPGVTSVDNLIEVRPQESDNDDELKDNIVTILEKDGLVDPRKFSVIAEDGCVTLRGRADSETERETAVRDCWYTYGVREVINEIEVI
ncbi:MAG: BON domain-containing protein [Desulfuromonadales bacterium]